MAAHSTILAWIPWAEEPGRLQSTGSLESGTTERLHFHALEKEMAAHSSVLARRIPGTGAHSRYNFCLSPPADPEVGCGDLPEAVLRS